MKIINIITLCFFAILTGCTSNKTNSSSLISYGSSTHSPTIKTDNICIKNITVSDSREGFQTGATKLTKNKSFFFLFLIVAWDNSGSSLKSLEKYDEDALNSLESLTLNKLNKSGFKTSPQAGEAQNEYDLDIEIVNFYKLSYQKNHAFVMYGGFFADAIFFPSSECITFRITISESKTGKVVGSKILSKRYLSGNDDPNATNTQSRDNAFARIMDELPYCVDSIIKTSSHSKGLIEKELSMPPETFNILRITAEYAFAETMTIGYDTGSIWNDTIEKRRFPVISEPGDWILSPYDLDGSLLHWNAYENLANLISSKYILKKEKYLNLYTFHGALQ